MTRDQDHGESEQPEHEGRTPPKTRNQYLSESIGVGMIVGVMAGILFGQVLLENSLFGISMGIGLGLAIGAAVGSQRAARAGQGLDSDAEGENS